MSEMKNLKQAMEERGAVAAIVCAYNVSARVEIPSGWATGGYYIAPEEDGLYILYMLADERNNYKGIYWERQPENWSPPSYIKGRNFKGFLPGWTI